LQPGNEFFPVSNKPIKIVCSKIKEQNHEYETGAILKSISSPGYFIDLMYCLFIWEKCITEKNKAYNNDHYTQSDEEDIPKLISDPESHFLTVNI
jgi:hypothetical protein